MMDHYTTGLRTCGERFCISTNPYGPKDISCPEACHDFSMRLPIRPQHIRRKVAQGYIHETLIFVGGRHLGVMVEKARHVLLVDLSVV